MIEFRECPCWTGNYVTVLSVYLIVSHPPGLSVSQESPGYIQSTPGRTTPAAPCGHRPSILPPSQTFIIPGSSYDLP